MFIVYLLGFGHLQAQCPTTANMIITGSLCPNNTLTFSVSNPRTLVYSWTIDGAQSTGTSVTYAYPTSGNKTVTLAATGCTSVNRTISISTLPNAAFTFTNNNKCSGDSLRFTATSTVVGLTYEWDFGDGTPKDNGRIVSHAFDASGTGTQTFQVSLKVTNTAGCSATTTQTITVVRKPEIALLDANTGSPFKNCGGGNYTLSVTNGSANTSNITGYTLNWGDGSPTLNLTNATFVNSLNNSYTKGLYNIVFTGTGKNGTFTCTAIKNYVFANQSKPTVGLQSSVNSGSKICGSSGYWFKLTNYKTNPGGTNYVWDFGDGSPVEVWKSPITVDSIFHTFSKSSCNGSLVNVTVKAKNECDSTVASINNLSVSIKPKADFTTDRSFGCSDVAVKFTNNSTKGLDGDCGDSTSYEWNFDDPGSSFNNVSTLQNPQHLFVTTGCYKVRLIAKGLYCTLGDTAIKQICISARPTNNFSLDNPPTGGCAPLDVKTTNNSNALSNIVPATYTWSSKYITGAGSTGFCGGASGSSSFFNSTPSDINPTIRFTLPGLYSVTLNVSNACGVSGAASKNVIVLNKPKVTVLSVNNTCGAVFVRPEANTNSCGTNTTFEWKYQSGNPATTIGETSPGSFFANFGNQKITLKATNTCGTDSSSTSFTIFEVPVITNTVRRQSVCSGSPTTLVKLNATIVGTRFNWVATQGSNNVKGFIATGSGDLPIQTFDNQGTTLDSVVYTITPRVDVCPGLPIRYVYYVYPKPKITSDVPNQSLCAGVISTPVNFSSNVVATAVSFTATGTRSVTGFTPSGTTSLPAQVLTNGSDNGDTVTYLVRGVNTYNTLTNTVLNCVADTLRYRIALNQIPVIQGGTLTLCSRDTVKYKPIINVKNTTFNWLVTNPTGNVTGFSPTGVGDSIRDVLISNVFVSETVKYNITPTGPAPALCTGQAVDYVVTVNPNPAVVYDTTRQQICSGKSTKAVSITTDTGILTWIANAVSGVIGFTTSGTDVIPVQTITNTTDSIVKVTYTITSKAIVGTCFAQSDYIVSVVPLPKTIVSPDDPAICNGASTALGLTSPTKGVTYAWAYTPDLGNIISGGSDGVGDSINQLLTNNSATSVDVSYSVKGSLFGCEGPATSTVVTVRPPAASVSATPSADTICSGEKINIKLTSSLPGATLSWSSPQNALIIGNTAASGNTITDSLVSFSNRSETVTYTTLSTTLGCNSTPFVVRILVRPSPTFTDGVLKNDTICGGASTTINISSPVPNTTFFWKATFSGILTGDTIGSGNTITQSLFNNGNTLEKAIYTVTPRANGCDGPVGVKEVRVYPRPRISATPLNFNICSKDSAIIAISSNILGTTFSWTIFPTSGAIGAVSGQGALINQRLLNSGQNTERVVYRITSLSNACSEILNDTVTINPLPKVEVGSVNSICEKTNVTLGGASSPGKKYEWTANGIIVSNASSFVVSPPNTTLYRLRAVDTITGCLDTNSIQLFVRPIPKVTFDVDSVVCKLEEVQIGNKTTGDTAIRWSFGDGKFSNLATNVKYAYTDTGSYFLKAVAISSFKCSDSLSKKIDVVVAPIASFTKDKEEGCKPLSVFLTNKSVGKHVTYAWDFGNGQPSTLRDPGNILYSIVTASDTTYILKLDVQNRCGISTFIDSVKVIPKPSSVIGTDKNYGCTPAIFTLKNASVGRPYSFIWNYGDGSPTSTTDAIFHTHAYYQVGKKDTSFTVSLISTNPCGVDTAYKVLKVSPNNINPFFNADVLEGCAPLKIKFTNYSVGATRSTWKFGDGAVGYDFDATHTYTKAGDYYVKMYADNGCAFDSTKTLTKITVHPLPDIKISVADTIGCNGKPITFRPIPSNLKSYVWNFGDNSPTSSTLQPTHSYSAGRFKVLVTAESAKGCFNYDSVFVRIFSPPVSQFSTDVLAGCKPLKVGFTNNSTNATSFFWKFGDGGTALGDSVSRQYYYLTDGTYKAKLFTSNLGCKDSTEKTIVVHPKPKSNFTISPETSCSYPAKVQTINKSTGSVSYEWKFEGVNQSSILISPSVNYPTLGNYIINLVAISDKGCRDTSTTNFLGTNSPKANFEAASPVACQNTFFSFLNKSSDADTYAWDFGDTTGVKNTPQGIHKYKNAGFYTVKLKVTKNGTCVDSITKKNFVQVFKRPLAAFDYDVDYNVPSVAQAEFTNQSVSGAKYFWKFGELDTTSKTNPSYQFNKSGEAKVQLIVQSVAGCTDTIIKNVLIETFKTLFVPTALTPGMGSPESSVFLPKGKSLKNYTLQIFDQFGTIIWESSKLQNGSPAEPWEGNDLDGKPIPPDVYVWKVSAEFEDGTMWKGQKIGGANSTKPVGTVTLIR